MHEPRLQMESLVPSCRTRDHGLRRGLVMACEQLDEQLQHNGFDNKTMQHNRHPKSFLAWSDSMLY